MPIGWIRLKNERMDGKKTAIRFLALATHDTCFFDGAVVNGI